MSYNARCALVCIGYALGLALIVDLGLWASGKVLILLVGAVAALAALVIIQPSMVALGTALTYVFAFTTSWQVVAVGPLRPSDLCFAGGLVVFVAVSVGQSARWPRFPIWALQLALVIAVVAALNAVLPYDSDYLAHRVFLDSNGTPNVPTLSNAGITVKWLIALVGVLALIGFATRWQPKSLYRIAIAYTAGAAVNGYVAISDRAGITHLGPRLLGVSYGTRQTGLTLHPNHLAEACTLGAPIACWLIARQHGWQRVVGVLALIGTAGGAYFSGSRGGAVVAALAIVTAFVLLQRLRARLVQIAGVAAVIMLAIVIEFPQLFGSVISTTRLGSSSSTDLSDQARSTLANQAIDDFRHSPIYGNGLQLALSSHDIYRQTLAAGGLVLLASMCVMLGFALRRAVQVARVDQLGVALAVTIGAFIVLGGAENFLTDRYLYLPFALAASGYGLLRASATERPALLADPAPAAVAG